MSISLINFIVILLFALIFGRKNTAKSRMIFILISSLWFVILTSIKSISVGSDTQNYVDYFVETFTIEWADLPMMMVERYIIHSGEFDIGFIILGKIISTFTHNFHIYTFIVLWIFYLPMCIILYRFSNNFFQLVFAFAFFVALISPHAIYAGRQLFALGFSFLSFICVDKGHYFKALIYIIIGATLHFSLLLFIIYIVLSRFLMDQGKKLHYLSFLTFPVILLFVNQIIIFMGDIAGSERYRGYGENGIAGGANVFISLMFLLSLFCYCGIKEKILSNNLSIKKMYLMLPLLTAFAPLIHSNGSMIRISLYFFMYMMILVPIAIENFFSPKQVKLVYCIVFSLLFLLSAAEGGVVYDFYWNDPVGTWNIK